MFCPKCGNSIPDGSAVCGYCGESLQAAKPAVNQSFNTGVNVVGASYNSTPSYGTSSYGTPYSGSALAAAPARDIKKLLIPVIAIAGVAIIVIAAIFLLGGNLEKKIVGEWKISMTEEQLEEFGDEEFAMFAASSFEVEFEKDGTGTISALFSFPMEWEIDGKTLTIEMNGLGGSSEMVIDKVKISGNKMTWMDENGDDKLIFEREK